MAGSIEKRKGDSYRLVYFAGYNLKGKPIKKTQTVHCKSMKEAKIELAKFVADCEKGMYMKGNPLNLKTSLKYGKEIMEKKNLHLQHIPDI